MCIWTSWGQSEPIWASWNNLGQSEPLGANLGQSGAPGANLGQSGAPGANLGLSGLSDPIWTQSGPNRGQSVPPGANVGQSGPPATNLGQSGPSGANLGQSEPSDPDLAHCITLRARMRARTISCPAVLVAVAISCHACRTMNQTLPKNLSARMRALNLEDTEQTQPISNFESIVQAYCKTLRARMRARANQCHLDLRDQWRLA